MPIAKPLARLQYLESKSRAASTPTRYALALGFLAVAFGIRLAVDPWLEHSMSHTAAITAVVLGAWYCGAGPAALIAALGYPLDEYVVLDHTYSDWTLGYLAPTLGFYVLASAAIISFVGWQRRDRDKLKDAEAKLRQSERRIRANFEKAAVGIVEVDSADRFIAVNERMCRIVGYSRAELIGMSVNDITLAEDRSMTGELSASLRSGLRETLDYEKRYVRRDGALLWVHLTASAVRDDAGRFLYGIGTVEDITERKQAEGALRAATAAAEEARTAAEEASQAKDRFLAVLSHELRTPLTPVLAAVQLLQRQPGVPDEMRRPLDIMRRNVELEARLIDDLLDLTRIAQGKIALERKPLEIATVIERAVETTKPDMEARKIHFGMELEAGHCWVNGDVSRLQQVVWNLLNNAVKFTAKGGRVAVRCRVEDRRVVIEVSDSGIGFETEAAARIFNAFEQGGNTITRQFGGMGLGLAIAKRLVEMHEGTISAHSGGPGRGATFRVSLPLVSGEEAARERAPATGVPRTSRRILLVEDNPDTATTMAMLLGTFGYQVETAGDVADALKAIGADGFDLLISDLGLPDRSGIDLMKELRQRGNVIKGIALTGYGQNEDVRRSREAGFSAHLTKPVDVEALVESVARVLRTPLAACPEADRQA